MFDTQRLNIITILFILTFCSTNVYARKIEALSPSEYISNHMPNENQQITKLEAIEILKSAIASRYHKKELDFKSFLDVSEYSIKYLDPFWKDKTFLLHSLGYDITKITAEELKKYREPFEREVAYTDFDKAIIYIKKKRKKFLITSIVLIVKEGIIPDEINFPDGKGLRIEGNGKGRITLSIFNKKDKKEAGENLIRSIKLLMPQLFVDKQENQ